MEQPVQFWRFTMFGLYFIGSIQFVLGVVLHGMIRSKKEGTEGFDMLPPAIHPLFFLPRFLRTRVQQLFQRKPHLGDSKTILYESSLNQTKSVSMNINDTKEDPDVRAEREQIHRENNPQLYAVQLNDVGKYFTVSQINREPKFVVRHLFLGIRYGECFGLLGPNGAGKTTTLSMIMGALEPSEGTIYISGKTSDPSTIWQLLGVCPQHDFHWDDLSVSQHLSLYARLKGTDPEKITALVQRAAEKSGLDGDPFHSPASGLSGGMKRRLSAAIAIVNNPPIVLMDEPSTGLDPQNRTHMWKIIQRLLEDRSKCVIMSSHSMEEVDALSTRIGIIAGGQLQCLGSQVHLKNKFGNRYKLSVRFTVEHKAPSNQDMTLVRRVESEILPHCLKYIQSYICQEAAFYRNDMDDIQTAMESTRSNLIAEKLKYSWNVTIEMSVPKSNHLGDLFERMDIWTKQVPLSVTNATTYQLIEWGLTQTTLEDVFIQVSNSFV